MNLGPLGLANPNDSRMRRVFAVVLATVFFLVFLRLVAPFFEALVLAAVFSALLFPLYLRFKRTLPSAPLAAITTTLLALLVVVLPLTVLVGVLGQEAVRVTEAVAPWVDGENNARELATIVPSWVPYRSQVISRAGEVVNQTGAFVIDRLTQATQSTVIFLLNLFVMLYAMFYFFMRGPRLLALLDEYTPLDSEDKLAIARRGVAITRATLKSLLIIGALQGALGGLAFQFAGLDSPVFWGIVMAVASALPSVGTALVWVPATVALLIRGDTYTALAFGAWCAIVVSSLDNVLRPHLVGNDAEMPDLLVLLSTLGGIALFGLAGIIIGPVLAGLFITSLDIFAATFERDLKDGAGTPAIVDSAGSVTQATRARARLAD